MTDFKKAGGSLEIIKMACLANQIYGQSFSQLMPRQQIDHILDTQNSFNEINERITNGGYSYYFINADNRQVGFFSYRRQLGDAIEITGIGLIKKQRGRGNAKRAVGFLKEKAKNENARTITIKIDKKNEPAIKAFTALGFEEIGSEQERLSGDFFVEKSVMALSLE